MWLQKSLAQLWTSKAGSSTREWFMELSSKTKGIVAIQEFLGKGNLTQDIQGHRPLGGQEVWVGEWTLIINPTDYQVQGKRGMQFLS